MFHWSTLMFIILLSYSSCESDEWWEEYCILPACFLFFTHTHTHTHTHTVALPAYILSYIFCCVRCNTCSLMRTHTHTHTHSIVSAHVCRLTGKEASGQLTVRKSLKKDTRIFMCHMDATGWNVKRRESHDCERDDKTNEQCKDNNYNIWNIKTLKQNCFGNRESTEGLKLLSWIFSCVCRSDEPPENYLSLYRVYTENQLCFIIQCSITSWKLKNDSYYNISVPQVYICASHRYFLW